MEPLRVVGTEVPRIEGRDKVTGASRYAVDVALPGMLWARFARGQVPHASLARVDVSKARSLPGVHAVLTGADIGDIRVGVSVKDMPLLCTDRVRYVGDPIAAVAAESPLQAADAVAAIDIEYAALPAVFDAEQAITGGAPILHDARASYTGAPELPPIPNLHGYNVIQKGDPEQAFGEADHVFEHTFRTAASHRDTSSRARASFRFRTMAACACGVAASRRSGYATRWRG